MAHQKGHKRFPIAIHWTGMDFAQNKNKTKGCQVMELNQCQETFINMMLDLTKI